MDTFSSLSSISHFPSFPTSKPKLRHIRCSSTNTNTDLAEPRSKLRRLVTEFRSLPEPLDRVKRLLTYASSLSAVPPPQRIPANLLPGCTAHVWLSATLRRRDNALRFSADSDSEITKGFVSCLLSVLDGATPEEVLEVRFQDFADLDVIGLPGAVKSRANPWHNVLVGMQKRARALLAETEPFPSLLIGADGIRAKGS